MLNLFAPRLRAREIGVIVLWNMLFRCTQTIKFYDENGYGHHRISSPCSQNNHRADEETSFRSTECTLFRIVIKKALDVA